MSTEVPLTPTCGNGTVEPPEKCDAKIASGKPGACPTDCDDKVACTKDSLINGGTCNAVCSNTPITDCVASDGCCPTGCNATTDSDCSTNCGNGIVEPPEKCDTKIAAGQPGACPTSCDDEIACTKDTLLNGGTCGAACSNTPVTQCVGGDGCCPVGCNASTDSDCLPNASWKAIISGTLSDLLDVHGTSANDIWVVGQDVVIHYDGKQWTPTTLSGYFTSVWAISTSDVWAVGGTSVDMLSPGVVKRYDGKQWSTVSGVPAGHWYGVWASTGNDVWLVSSDATAVSGSMAHFDGQKWTSTVTPARWGNVWGSGAKDVWASGSAGVWHYDGSVWTSSLSGGGTYGLWGVSSTEVWAVSGNYTVSTFDGKQWTTSSTNLVTAGFPGSWNDIWGTSSNDLWVVAGNLIGHFDGQKWTKVTAGLNDMLRGLWGTSGNNIWAVGEAGKLLHYSP